MERTPKKLTDRISGMELEDHTNETIQMVSFQHAAFQGVDMRSTSLEHVNFAGSKWEHIYFSNVHVKSIQMGGTVFEHIVRPRAVVSQLSEELGTDGWVNVEPVVFRNSDLSKAIFDNCQLRGVELRDCDIEGLTVNGISVLDLLLAYQSGQLGQRLQKQEIISTELIEKPSFLAVGLSVHFKPGTEKPSESTAARLWESFNSRRWEIPYQLPQGSYGISFFGPHYQPGSEIDYFTAVEVTKLETLPDGMVARQIPASTYAAVTYRGPLDGIGTIYSYFWKEWLPSSGYEPSGGHEFEYYDQRYIGNHHPDSIMQVYFPIRKKAASAPA